MPRPRRAWLTSIGTVALILACTCAPLSNGVLPPADGTSSSPDDFPRTPNPVTVHATLDTAYAASNANWARPGIVNNSSVNGETADGVGFSLFMPGALLSESTDGELIPAFGSVVTVTPVSAIDDIPFSQGYLAAVHIGPDGLSMVEGALLSLTIPGDYAASQMIGFAAEGTGEDFHLFPTMAESYNGTTEVTFSTTHFSLYGVALATLQDIQAQRARPPVSPASQDEDELAPLVRIDEPSGVELAPLVEAIQLQLDKSYNRLVKRDMDRLSSIACGRINVVAQNFNNWRAKAETANQTAYFEQRIKRDATSLHVRLTACARPTCQRCLSNTPGNKLDKATVSKFLVLAAFAGDMAAIMDRSDLVVYWFSLSQKCAEEVDLPPLIMTGGGGGDGGTIPTPVPLTCE